MSTAIEKKEAKLAAADMVRPLGGEQSVMQLFAQYRKAFMVAAPRHLDVDRMLRIAMMNVSRNPQLLECTMGSLLATMMAATQLGLELGGPLQQAHPVPFFNKNTGQKEIQLVIDFRGYVHLARNSGQLQSFTANVVYRQDRFDYEDGLVQKLVHVPNDDHDEKDEDIVAAYAIARFKDGGFQVIVIRRRRLDRIRAMSKMANGDPWKNHLAEMFKKTAIRRLAKLLPLSPEVALANRLDDRHDAGKPQHIELAGIETFQKAELLGSAVEAPIITALDDPAEAAAASVPLSAVESARLDAWLKKFGWKPGDIIELARAFDLAAIHAVPAADLERLLAVIEAGPAAFMAASQPAGAGDPDKASEKPISTQQYDDLWAFATEFPARKDALIKWLKTQNLKKVSDISVALLPNAWAIVKGIEK